MKKIAVVLMALLSFNTAQAGGCLLEQSDDLSVGFQLFLCRPQILSHGKQVPLQLNRTGMENYLPQPHSKGWKLSN